MCYFRKILFYVLDILQLFIYKKLHIFLYSFKTMHIYARILIHTSVIPLEVENTETKNEKKYFFTKINFILILSIL